MKKVIAYLNQFFGQIGGEDMARIAPRFESGPVGPGMAMQAKLEDAGITHTIICGDDYMASDTAGALARIDEFLSDKEFDLLIAGPAFNAGRYGFSCGEVCRLAGEKYNVPAVTSMFENNPGVELYRGYAYIVKGHDSAAGMRHDLPAMASLANKLLRGEPLLGAEEEGYFKRGIRKEVLCPGRKNAADRAVDMLLAKLSGRPYVSELVIEKEEVVAPLPPVDASGLKIAFVTTSGLVPAGNPDRLPSGSATIWRAYDVGDRDILKPGEWISVHGGYNTSYAAENPSLMVPWDALKRHAAEGHVKSLHPRYYVTTGNQTTKGDARRMAREIVEAVKKDGVDAIILGST